MRAMLDKLSAGAICLRLEAETPDEQKILHMVHGVTAEAKDLQKVGEPLNPPVTVLFLQSPQLSLSLKAAELETNPAPSATA